MSSDAENPPMSVTEAKLRLLEFGLEAKSPLSGLPSFNLKAVMPWLMGGALLVGVTTVFGSRKLKADGSRAKKIGWGMWLVLLAIARQALPIIVRILVRRAVRR
jgi:hypothetical protein